MRLEFYDGTTSLGWTDAVEGNWVNPEWTYVEGKAVAPDGADTVKIKLLNTMSNGWVTYDDVTLRACDTSGTQGGPGAGRQEDPDGGVPTLGERGLARLKRVVSPEEVLSRQPSRLRYEDLVECVDPKGCPEIESALEAPNEVQWVPATDVEKDLTRSLTGTGGDTQAAGWRTTGSIPTARRGAATGRRSRILPTSSLRGWSFYPASR